MSIPYHVGIFKMSMDKNGELIPFSEEIIPINNYNEMAMYLKENGLDEGVEEVSDNYSYNKLIIKPKGRSVREI